MELGRSAGSVAIPAARTGRHVFGDAEQLDRQLVGIRRMLPGNQKPQDCGGGVDVGADINGGADLGLLGGAEAGSAPHHRRATPSRQLVLGQTEVSDNKPLIRPEKAPRSIGFAGGNWSPDDEEVGWVDVAVDDSGGVECTEALCKSPNHSLERCSVCWKCSGAQTILQAAAFGQVHHQIGTPVRRLADVVDRDDRGMADPPHQPRFAHKPLADLRIDGLCGGQDFEGNIRIQALIPARTTTANPPTPMTGPRT